MNQCIYKVGKCESYLCISERISDNEEAGFKELLLDLVGESTGGVATTDVLSAGVLGELEHSALAESAGGDDNDVLGVLDGDDNAGSEHKLLPGLAQVDDVDSC